MPAADANTERKPDINPNRELIAESYKYARTFAGLNGYLDHIAEAYRDGYTQCNADRDSDAAARRVRTGPVPMPATPDPVHERPTVDSGGLTITPSDSISDPYSYYSSRPGEDARSA